MFTVKHYRSDGQIEVYGCDRYNHDAESPRDVRMFTHGRGWEVLEFRPDDSVYIENGNGKTVTTFRPPKTSD